MMCLRGNNGFTTKMKVTLHLSILGGNYYFQHLCVLKYSVNAVLQLPILGGNDYFQHLCVLKYSVDAVGHC